MEVQLKQLQAEQMRLQGEIDVNRVNDLSAETVLHEAKQLQKRWFSTEILIDPCRIYNTSNAISHRPMARSALLR